MFMQMGACRAAPGGGALEGEKKNGGIVLSWFGPAALAGAFLVVLAALLGIIHQRVRDERLASLPADAEMARAALTARLAEDRDFLVRLAEDRTREDLDEVAFEERAGRHAASRTEVSGVTWVGPDLVIHRVSPSGPAGKTVGAAISRPERKSAVALAVKTGRAVYTRPFTETPGDAAFELWIPLHRGEEFLGLFGIGYSCARLIRHVPNHLGNDYWLTVNDAAGATVAALPPRSSVETAYAATVPFDPPGHGYALRLQRYGTGTLGSGIWILSLLCAALAMGMAYGMYALRRDMERRRLAEKARDLLAAAIDQTAEAIIITDPAGVIRYVNPAFQRITGYSEEEVVGESTQFLKSGKRPPEFFREMWSTILRGEVWTGSFENRRKDGTVYEEEAVISPVRDGAGQIVNFVAVKRDVTRERRMEERLRQAQKMEAVGRMAGGVAHDFNNLLTAITGYSDLLLRRMDENSPMRRDVLQIHQAGERASSLTRQLLAVSRSQILHPKLLDLNAEIARMEPALRGAIGLEVQLSVVPAPDLWRTKLDPGQVEQVLLNLAVNAREAMPQGGRLTIETANVAGEAESDRVPVPPDAAGRRVLLAMSDTGRGMDEETIKRIFDPFFTTKNKGEGPGLGLSTAYGIVSQSGGHFAVSSELGRGTTFRIYLPAVDEAPEEEEPAGCDGREGPAR
jgi:PAS domain S-box-containing protein